MAPLAPGSALAVTILTADGAPTEMAGVAGAASEGGIPGKLRTRTEVEAFFTEVEAFFAGLDLVDPGVVLANRWRPEPQDEASGGSVPVYGGDAIKR